MMYQNKFAKNKMRFKKRYLVVGGVIIVLCTGLKWLSDNRLVPSGYPVGVEVVNSTITANYVDDSYLTRDPSYPRVLQYKDYGGKDMKVTCANPFLDTEYEGEFKSILTVKFRSFKNKEESDWAYLIY